MSSLQDKLYNYEQTPPEKAWDKIAAALDKEEFANRLYNYEQMPPAKAWNKIVAALDEAHIENEFPSKLYHAEAMPPANAWEKITGLLNADDPAVIQMPKRNFPILRYAAAAVVIGFIAFVVIKFAGKSTADADGRNDVAIQKPDTSSSPTDNNFHANTDEEAQEPVRNDENSNAIVVREASRTFIKKVKNKYAVSENIDATEPIYASNDYWEHTPNLSERYIMLMTPNGVIRMSKKWGTLICCVSGQEQDEDCKDQIKKWQEKLAASPANSTGNFMDILSLVSSLDGEL